MLTNTTPPEYGPRLRAWDKRTDLILTLLSLVFLLAYGWEVIANLQGPRSILPDTILNIVWVLFGIDYIIRLSITQNRKLWFTRHILDLLVVVLPFFRPLRLLRLIHLAANLHRKTSAAFRGRVITYIIASSIILLIIASLGVLDAEQNAPGANITSFGNALWWAFVTMATVGYGDYHPITIAGRLVAVGLMLSGIALIGSVTATFASWFIEQINHEKEHKEMPTTSHTINQSVESDQD